MNGEWALRISAVLVGTVLTVATEVIAAFLTAFRVGATPVPISWVVLVAGLVGGLWITYYGSQVAGLTAIPALAWFGVIFPLSSKTAEGDLAVQGNWVGYGLLLIGMLTIVVTIGFLVVRPQRRIS